MKLSFTPLAAGVICLLFLSQGHTDAITLSSLLNMAAQTEPNYLSSQADIETAQARKRQALGDMLPHLSVSGSRQHHRRRYESLDTITPVMHDKYNTESAQLELNQHIWHRESQMALREAEQHTSQASFKSAHTLQQLFRKITDAWFDLLAAEDATETARAQKETLQIKARIATRSVDAGLSDAPEALEAQAKSLQALANEQAANMKRQVKLAELEQYVTLSHNIDLPSLDDNTLLPDLINTDLVALLETAYTTSPAIRAAQDAIAAAETDIARQRAGHQPSLDLTASYSLNDQDVGNFPGQPGYDIRDYYIGLKLNIPLYAGGSQSARVKEAIAQRNKAQHELESTWRETRRQIETAYFLWHTNRTLASTQKAIVDANQLLLKQAQKGVATGLNSQADLLEARQRWIETRNDWRKACYEALRAYTNLKAALGQLEPKSINVIDRYFSTGAALPKGSTS